MRDVEIGSDVAHWVDNRCTSLTATAKEVRNCHRIRMQKLPEYHLSLQCRALNIEGLDGTA